MSRKHTKNLDWREWLCAWFGTREGSADVWFMAPRRSDSRLLYDTFYIPRPPTPEEPHPRSLIQELEARGYDTATLEFRIKRKGVAR